MRFIFSIFIAALAALPALSHADETRWEVIRVYALGEGRAVAVAVPAEWQELSDTRVVGTRSALRFLDQSGAKVEIPAAVLEQAAANKRVLRPEELKRPPRS